MNTRIEYSYRDGANYKQDGHIIITGEASRNQVEALRKVCMQEDGQAYFVPESVGMTRLATSTWDNEIDHPFHTLDKVTLVSERKTDQRSIYDLVNDFSSIKWEEEAIAYKTKYNNNTPQSVKRTDNIAVKNVML